MVILRGRVSLRSSAGRKGPPGEVEIGRLNPQRTSELLQLTGWNHLQPGTLNVECEESELANTLDHRIPDWLEPPEAVNYPDKYAYIPKKRGGYRYFLATLRCRGMEKNVVVRRAVNPVRGRAEVYAAEHLRESLNLNPDDEIDLIF